MIEIHGQVSKNTQILSWMEYQLRSGATANPSAPKNYDVEKKGRYSAGKLSHPKPATYIDLKASRS